MSFNTNTDLHESYQYSFNPQTTYSHNYLTGKSFYYLLILIIYNQLIVDRSINK